MADIPDAQVKAFQQIMANVEVAYRQVTAAKTSLSILIDAGRATCTDIRTYNIQVKSVYFYQASVASLLKANGERAPAIPAPVYVTYRGVSGDQAINIDCPQGQLRGWRPNGLGDVFVNPKDVEWRQEALPSDTARVLQVVNAANQSKSNLGAAGLGFPIAAVVIIILAGIVVGVVGHYVLKWLEAVKDVPSKIEDTKQMTIQGEQYKRSVELRANCYTDCSSKGKDPVECAKTCDKLIPGFSPKFSPSSGSVLGMVGVVAVLGVAAYFTYRYVKSSTHGGGHKELEASSYDEDDYIDV